MPHIESVLYELGKLDSLAAQETYLHRLDGRTKVLTTLVFIAIAVSFGRYEVSRLLPLLMYPAALITAGNVPFGYVLRRVLYATPFVIFIAMFNLFFDRAPILHWGGIAVSGGVVSFASIMLRFMLTVGTAVALVAVTGIFDVCMALERLKVPRVFVLQLLFVYRYIFVLIEEALRLVRAHKMRSCGRALSPRVFARMVGQLLLRTVDRAQRVHQSMLCRGFNGAIHLPRGDALRQHDWAFIFLWTAFLLLVRFVDVPVMLGRMFVR